jgi:hypothetical protein
MQKSVAAYWPAPGFRNNDLHFVSVASFLRLRPQFRSRARYSRYQPLRWLLSTCSPSSPPRSAVGASSHIVWALRSRLLTCCDGRHSQSENTCRSLLTKVRNLAELRCIFLKRAVPVSPAARRLQGPLMGVSAALSYWSPMPATMGQNGRLDRDFDAGRRQRVVCRAGQLLGIRRLSFRGDPAQLGNDRP